ncbi:MAG: SAM-dependent methyltransferase [Deltaproteobacteria bacterium]|nr:SAM-dependent methyltransferase [Candidatus Anaeroferrophillacea bacterium]
MVTLNRTNAFYEAEDPSLLWELTICQSIGMGTGGYASALREPAPYGTIVGRRLRNLGLPAAPVHVVEIGGGWGTLMRGLLRELEPCRLTMVDISAALLARQCEALGTGAGTFVQADAREFLAGLTDPADLVIANEIIGDLPTVTDIPRAQLAPHLERAARRIDAGIDSLATGGSGGPPQQPAALYAGGETANTNARGPLSAGDPGVSPDDRLLAEAARLITAYDLDITGLPEQFNLNLGALHLVEALASAPVSRAFISEHGADTEIPWPFAALPRQYSRQDRNPRRIPLKDHDEYTIRFDHLEAAARRQGFTVRREHMMELLDVRFDDEINYLLGGGRPASEDQEMLLEFLDHVAEYQVLYLERHPG